jgi:predicted membrane channel-forming protein YqfA (hemolysin III family)
MNLFHILNKKNNLNKFNIYSYIFNKFIKNFQNNPENIHIYLIYLIAFLKIMNKSHIQYHFYKSHSHMDKFNMFN